MLVLCWAGNPFGPCMGEAMFATRPRPRRDAVPPFGTPWGNQGSPPLTLATIFVNAPSSAGQCTARRNNDPSGDGETRPISNACTDTQSFNVLGERACIS